MKLTQYIKVESILIDNLPINPKTFELALYLKNNSERIMNLPPISVEKSDKGGYKIKDGRHRVAAFKLLGLTIIQAYVSVKTI